MNRIRKMTSHTIAACLVILMVSFNIQSVSAQSAEEKTLQQAEKMPEFKGGNDALIKYLSENIVYPAEAKNKGEEGKVFVSFIVDKTGAIKNAQIRKGVSATLNAEALRVVNSMPAWTPGEQDGKKVNVEYTLPIMFSLK